MNSVAQHFLDVVRDLTVRQSLLEKALVKLGPRPDSGFPLPGRDPASRAEMEEDLRETRIGLGIVRRARIFDLSPEIYDAAYRRADSGELIGVPDLNEALPFDVCWFGSGNRDMLDILYPDPQTRDAVPGGGMILSRCGLLILPNRNRDGHWACKNLTMFDAEGTDPATVYLLWTLALCGMITRGRPATSPRPLSGKQLALRAGRLNLPPPALYEVSLDARGAGRTVGALVRPHTGPGYRFEVGGHPRLLIRRGAWPDPERCAAWVERGYEIVHGGAVPPAWQAELALRGLQGPKEREWFALRIVHVREHERGPEGPVTPSIRVAR